VAAFNSTDCNKCHNIKQTDPAAEEIQEFLL
jgi:nitrate/TMAO reductase-like tetraheme cytochrome c subunit